jgi:hypothetical protein
MNLATLFLSIAAVLTVGLLCAPTSASASGHSIVQRILTFDAAGAWKIYTRAKRYLGAGAGTVTLGAGVFKMCLHRTSASANILKVSNGGISTFASVGSEISATGGYVAGGRNIGPATGKWTVGASTKQMKFTYTTAGLVFTANGANLTNIRYALLRNSTGAGAGKVLCFCTLSTAAFTITSPNTLTISPAATGVFTMA